MQNGDKLVTFSFGTAGRIIFGVGSFAQVDDIAIRYGQRILIVASPSTQDHALQLEERLRTRGAQVACYTMSGEPDVQSIEQGYQIASDGDYACIIALGGGSVIDAGKAIAGLLTNGGTVLDYVEVVGAGKPLNKPAAPLIAVPTTAGTGAEVTRNAVITIPDRQVKVSMRSPNLLPAVALVDPELTYSLPPDITASTGLDALTQLIEPYTCNRTNPLTDALALSGLGNAASWLLVACLDGLPEAREAMAYASLCGGLALANSGLGAVHGFAGVLGARYAISHGLCCAMLLPHVVEGNIAALQSRGRDNAEDPLMLRYKQVTKVLAEAGHYRESDPSLDALPYMLHSICHALRIPHLADYGVTEEAIPDIVQQAMKASSMGANPIALSTDELMAILEAAL